MAEFVAAIDQGTTSSRCALVDHSGAIVAVRHLEHELDDDLALVPETRDGLTEDDLDEGEDYPVDEEWPDEFIELP